MNDLLINIVKRQKKEILSLLDRELVERTISSTLNKSLTSPLIKILLGPRRAGKSTLALQALRSKSFSYLNFEDESLSTVEDGDRIMEALEEVYGITDFIFFDEIQNLNRWEPFINRLHRLGKNIIATGSNAKLLSDELSSALTGRHIQIEVFPFSFKEISNFQDASLENFQQFLVSGGFPEVINNKVDIQSYLSALWDSVILKDIARRKNIRNLTGLSNLLNLMLSGITSRFSVDSLVAALNSEVSAPTAKKFLSYAYEAYLISELSLYNFKPKKRLKSDRKSYVTDNGFFTAKNINASNNHGKLLENAVFTELRIRGFIPNTSLFYYSTKSDCEVDFILRSGHESIEAIQVCYCMSSLKTKERELRALYEASKELNIKKLTIISLNDDATETYKDSTIQVMPAIEWFLDRRAR